MLNEFEFEDEFTCMVHHMINDDSLDFIRNYSSASLSLMTTHSTGPLATCLTSMLGPVPTSLMDPLSTSSSSSLLSIVLHTERNCQCLHTAFKWVTSCGYKMKSIMSIHVLDKGKCNLDVHATTHFI